MLSWLLGALVLLAVFDPMLAAHRYDQVERASWRIPVVTPLWMRFSVLDLCGSILVCDGYRRSRRRPKSWLESLVISYFMQFGGTTLVGFFLGQPPSWLLSKNAARSLLLVWWCTFYCPGDLWFRLLSESPLKSVVSVGAALSSGHAATSWGVDKALKASHIEARSSVFLAILCGTFGACGGSVFAAFYFKDEPQRADNARNVAKKAFYATLLYYTMLDPHEILWSQSATCKHFAKLAVGLYSLFYAAKQQLNVGFDPVRTVEEAITFLFFQRQDSIGLRIMAREVSLSKDLDSLDREHKQQSSSSSSSSSDENNNDTQHEQQKLTYFITKKRSSTTS